MHATRSAKSVFMYLALLLMMLVAVTGVLLARDLHARNPDFQITTNTQLQDQLSNSDVKILSAPNRPCLGFQIYTSLPPKCRTSDGTFTPLNELPSNIINIPQLK